MAKLLKLRRGTTSQHSSFTGAEGEVTVDTDKEALVVHNGSTAGGFPVARADGTGVTNFTITGELDAATLDISGNADIDGTLEADAYTVNGTALDTHIAGVTVTNATNAAGLTGTPNITVGVVTGGSLDISGDADIDGTLEADAYTVNGTALDTHIAGVTVTNATNAVTATNANHVSVADNESTNENNKIVFIEDASATGNVGLESDGDLHYNPSTGLLTVPAVSTSGNITIAGNLTVNGTTTTVATTNTTVTDNLLELNSGASSNANDAGILIERGSTGDNAIIAWDESADKFTVGTTTATNDATGNISITTGTLVANVEGNLTGNVTGQASALSGSRTIGGVVFDNTGDINLPGVNTGGNQNTTGSAATLTTPRAINGVNFNGSADITVTAAAGTLSGGTLASGVTASSLTSVGTMTGLNVNGDASFSGASYNILWDKSDNALEFGDNAKGSFGTDGDLEIYHTGSSNYIKAANSHSTYISGEAAWLNLQSNAGIQLTNVGNTETFLKATNNNSVELYYNHTKRIETTDSGINVTGAINVNGSPLSSAPTIDLTASGSIAANKPVIVNTSGQAVEVSIPSDQTGSGVKMNSTASTGTKCASDGSGKYMMASSDGSTIKARIATISGTTISYGTEVNVASSNSATDGFDLVYVKQRDCYMIVYQKSSSDLWVRCLTVSGTSITTGTESQQSNQLNTRISLANATDSASGWCCVFFFDEAQNRLWMKSLKPADTITNAVGEGNTAYISGRSGTTNCHVQYNPDQQRFYGLTYYHPSTALYCESWTCAESNGGISRSGTYTVSSSIIHDGGYGWMRWGLTYSPTIKKMLVSYPTGSGNGTGKIRTLTHVDGSWTAGSESTLGSNYDWMRMATHEATEQMWMVFTQSTGSGWNNDGKGPIRIRKITVNSSGTISLGSTTTLDSGEYLRNDICDGDDGMFITAVDEDGSYYPEAWFHKIGQTNMTAENFVGFSSAGYSNGQTATINVVGNTTTQSSLTPGQKYYVQGAGTVGTDPSNPSVEAGLAVSSTKLLIR